MTRPRALVVDDHPANIKLLSFVLEVRGFEVIAAQDAEEALAALERGLPAIVLMDVQMPRVDGLTLTRQLRADPRYAQLPIVAVTAYAMASDEREAREAGCTAFVSKPIDTRALGELVLRLTQGNSP